MKDIWDILDTVVLEQVQNKDVYIYIYQEHFYESICVFLDALNPKCILMALFQMKDMIIGYLIRIYTKWKMC